MKEKKNKILLITILALLILTIVGVVAIATGNNGIDKSVTFNENMDGYYVYFRAVDSAGNAGDWSAAQRIWIDTTVPTVTAKQNTVTITEGDDNLLIDYFNIIANGTNADIDTECKINNTVYERTGTLTAEGSPYTVTCTATKNGGNSNNGTMQIIVEPALEPVDFSSFSVAGGEYMLTVYNVPGGVIAEVTITNTRTGVSTTSEIDNSASETTLSWKNISYAGSGTVTVVVKFKNSKNVYYDYQHEWTGTITTCFVAGTLVLTEDGYKNIEDIKIGEYVYSMNLETMEVELCKILMTFKNEVDYDTCLIYAGEEYIESTTGHPYYEKEKGWIDAIKVEVGDTLINANGEEIKVEKVEIKEHEEKIIVYNVEVEKNHNYFVGENMVLVHNHGGGGCGAND